MDIKTTMSTTLCGCGCGMFTPLATTTNKRLGRYKGQPCKFRHGHSITKPLIPFERRYVQEDCGYKTPCWIWRGKMNGPYGYHRIPVTGQMVFAHRHSFELSRGLVPENKMLDHLCRTPACINPDHLEIVTNMVNVQRGLLAIGNSRNHQRHPRE